MDSAMALMSNRDSSRAGDRILRFAVASKAGLGTPTAYERRIPARCGRSASTWRTARDDDTLVGGEDDEAHRPAAGGAHPIHRPDHGLEMLRRRLLGRVVVSLALRTRKNRAMLVRVIAEGSCVGISWPPGGHPACA
jgi:hypothetical protein